MAYGYGLKLEGYFAYVLVIEKKKSHPPSGRLKGNNQLHETGRE